MNAIRRWFGGHTDSPVLLECNYVVLDTELSGLDRAKDDLLSIGAIRMRGASIALGQTLNVTIMADADRASQTTALHGLRPADLALGMPLPQALGRLADFVRPDDVLVGHYLELDLAFLARDMRAHRLQALRNKHADTLQVLAWLDQAGQRVPRLPDGSPALRLFEACAGLGIEVDEAHDALADAWLTAQLWQWQLHALAAAGITRLSQL